MSTEENKPKKHGGGMKIIPQSVPLTVLMIVVFLIEAVFLFMLEGLNILPGKFTVPVLIVLIAVLVLIVKLLCCRKDKTKQRKVGVVISAVVIAVMAVGIYYLYTTSSMFGRISSEDVQTEDFYVMAIKGGSYSKLKDIDGETVYITSTETDTYAEAKEELLKEVDVDYSEADADTDGNGVSVSDNFAVGCMLVDEEGNKDDNVIFISSGIYEILCDEISEFEDNTRIIYTITVEVESDDIADRTDVTKNAFNVYISGIDTYGGISKVSRSDVNMIMTVNPVTKEILLTSIPRDMYVTLHTYGAKDKLTHSGIYGVDETVSTVEDWLGVDINYYIRVNFTTLVDVVDALGGIEVESDYAFSAGGYSFVVGTNQLDGDAALAFSRERYSFSSGDNQRVKNQQKVITGIINKITGSTAILTKYTQLLNSVGDEMQTNLSSSDISALVKMQLKDLGGWTIKSISVTGTGTYSSTYSMGSTQLYVMIPDDTSVSEAQEEITKVMNGED